MRFFHKRIQYESFDGHGPLSRKKAERKRQVSHRQVNLMRTLI